MHKDPYSIPPLCVACKGVYCSINFKKPSHARFEKASQNRCGKSPFFALHFPFFALYLFSFEMYDFLPLLLYSSFLSSFFLFLPFFSPLSNSFSICFVIIILTELYTTLVAWKNKKNKEQKKKNGFEMFLSFFWGGGGEITF